MWCTVNVVDLRTVLDKSSYFCNFTSSPTIVTLNSKEFRINGLKIAILNFDSNNPIANKSTMVGSNGTMIAIRLVRSKLRKREEHSNSIHPADVVQTTAGPAAPSTTTPSSVVPQALQADTLTYQGQFLWPPPVQPYSYNNDQVGATLLKRIVRLLSFCFTRVLRK